jgi:DNA-binding transcriptional LysR family regulator
MEMQQVRYFVALAQTLNFTRAAEQCNVSQPALTRAIQQLEAELGGPLFHRERGNTHLSELGRMMLPYLANVMDQTRAAKESAKALAKLDRAVLKIGAMCTISAGLVADLVARFSMQHPDVEVRIRDGGAPQMIDAMEKGELEIAVIGVPEELPESFHAVPIFEERFVVLLPPNHRLAMKNPVTGPDLNGEPYVSRAACEVFDHVRKDLAARGIVPRKVFSSTRDDWVQAMIKVGLGFGFFPESCVTDGDLVARELVDPAYTRTIYLATVRGRPYSPAVGAFVREARRHRWPATTAACPVAEAA